MKNVIRISVVLAALGAVLFMGRQHKQRLDTLDALSDGEWRESPGATSPPPPPRRTTAGGPGKNSNNEGEAQSGNNAKDEGGKGFSVPHELLRMAHRNSPRYDEEFMRGFLGERREMDKLDTVSIGRSDYGVARNHKAVLLPAGEGEGYYRVGSWTVVPLDYGGEEEGYPVLFNKNDRTVSIMTGLVSAKLKEGIPLERGMELVAGENGLEVDTVTRHLKIVHVKFSPVTARALEKYKKKMNEMGVFSRLEFEIDGGGPYPN